MKFKKLLVKIKILTWGPNDNNIVWAHLFVCLVAAGGGEEGGGGSVVECGVVA
jgi:hypothetical protein